MFPAARTRSATRTTSVQVDDNNEARRSRWTHRESIETGAVKARTTTDLVRRVAKKLSEPAAMIEHMFDSVARGGAGGDDGATPASPAMQQVSATSEWGGEAPAAPSWRDSIPGPEMIAALAEVSLQACTDEQLLDVLTGWERVTAWVAAQQIRVLARTEARLWETAVRQDRDLTGAHRQVETEISAALRWTSRTTIPRLDLARDLTGRLPQVLDAMNAGQISYRHAEVISKETQPLTDPQARRLVDRLLPEAGRRNPIGLRNRLRKAVLQIDPDAANERAKKAVTERSVTMRPLDDGLAQLEAIGPAADVLAMYGILQQAAASHHKDDPRTTTARRFDALTDLLLSRTHRFAGLSPDAATDETATDETATDETATGRAANGRAATGRAGSREPGSTCPPPSNIAALVQITMDIETLLGLRNNPADLHGYGPLPANLARMLAADADWQRFIQDPLTGEPVDLGRTRRHPDAALRRWIIARDRTCLFPECYRPAKDCEPDHNPAWATGGGTDKDTLNQLCPKHHKVRHHGWTYQRHPDRITWTSPHERVYQRYFLEADLIGPDEACPHLDAEHDDTIWPPVDDDQRLDIFLPRHRPGQPAEPDQEIPWDIVQAFRLEDLDTWPIDANGKLLDELILTPEQEQELLDQAHFRRYGSIEPPPPENPTYRKISSRTLTDRARSKQAWKTLPDEPPF